MAKTKTQSTEEEGGKSSKTLTSFGQFFQASNLLPQSQELHKGLNMNSKLFPNVEQETSLKQNTSKRKRKNDVSFSTSFEFNENDTSEQIDNVSNTTSNYGSLKKQKKSKSKNLTSDNTSYVDFTPKRLPKEEDNQEDYDQNNHEDSYRSLMSSEEMDEKDSELIKSVEEKVKKIQVLQDIQLSPTKVIKDPKQMLHYRYPNLTQLDMKTDLKLHDTDEVFLFRTPKNVDPQVLENLDIDVETGGKVKIGLKKYIVRPTSQIPHPCLILAKRNKIVNFKRHIVMELYVKPPKESKSLTVERSSIELPNELKNRHPLFGSDFEEKINLDRTVEKKIDDAITNLLKQKKKKPKKSAKKDLGKPEIGSSFESIMAGKPVKKKRMTKSALIEETLNLMKRELNTESDSEALLHKKKKKSKYKKGQRDRDQNDSLSNLSVKEETPKDKIINSTMVANSSKTADFSADVSYITPDVSKKAKIKKEKKLLNNDTFLDSSSSKKRKLAEEPEDVPEHKKKKKKKKMEID